MERFKFIVMTFLLITIFTFSLSAQSTARLQVIHNAADPGASVVDVYLNGSILIDDFEFRKATSFIDAPADEEITIDIAPSTSASSSESIAKFNFTLAGGETYVAVANGVLNPDDFTANPDGKSIAFDIYTRGGVLEAGMDSNNVDFVVFHGSTDAPTVDVIARDVATIVDNAAYTDFTDYVSVPAAKYLLDVTPGEDNETIVGTFEADLSSLGGGAAVVFASGFLAPAEGQAAFGIFAALPNGDVVEFPAKTTARLQVIHNAADPAAKMVDIYLNDGLLLDNFEFRKATPYIDAPANQEIKISVAPMNSSSSAEAIADFFLNLKAEEKYAAIANGVLNPDDFTANPDGKDIAFTIFVKEMTREMAMDAYMVEFFVLHGATDAPTVDVIARDVATLVDNAPYSAMTDYIAVPPAKYLLDVTPGDDNETIVGTFEADLSGLAGGAAAVFASGFLAPTEGQAAFGIFAALPNGDVVEFMPITTARLQVIHNAADPAAKMVDIYLNDGLLLDDFEFRTATPFIDAPANEDIVIGVAPMNSTSSGQAIATFNFNLKAAEKYVAVANGVLSPQEFLPNPDGKNTAFDIYVKVMAREMAMDSSNVDFTVFHGVTDAPAVDVRARHVAELVNGLMYGGFTDYISVNPESYIIDMSPAQDSSLVLFTYDGALGSLQGGAAVVFASGFVMPAQNQNGEGFALYAALPDGQTLAFGEITTAKVQIIHNAADPAAASVDIYLGADLAIDDFGFRTATGYIELPANQPIEIGVAPGTSSSANDVIKSFPLRLLAADSYLVVANGVLDPAQFISNPEGRDIGFTLFIKDGVQMAEPEENEVALLIVHGSTDAPAVDIIARDVATLARGAAYADITRHIIVPEDRYTIDVAAGSGNASGNAVYREGDVVASYDVDLNGLGGSTAVVFASGFLNADDGNQNGQTFGLYAATTEGQVVEFSSVTSIGYDGFDAVIGQFELNQNYPNPFNPSTTISFALPRAEEVSLKIYNIAGQLVSDIAAGRYEAGVHQVNFNAADLSTGIYFYILEAGSFKETRRMTLIK